MVITKNFDHVDWYFQEGWYTLSKDDDTVGTLMSFCALHKKLYHVVKIIFFPNPLFSI